MSETGVLIMSMCCRLPGKGNVFSYDPDPHLPTVCTMYCIPTVLLYTSTPHRPSYTLCMPTYTHTNTYCIYICVPWSHSCTSSGITFFPLYFHQHIYLVRVEQNMIVMIMIIIMVSPHSLSGSFVALSSSSTGTQAQAPYLWPPRHGTLHTLLCSQSAKG